MSGGAHLRWTRLSIGRWQQAAWWGGLSLTAIALISPIDGLGHALLSAHMAQHLLIADLGGLLLLAGLRAPLLLFFLPRAVLVALARRRRLGTLLHTLRQPLVAVPLCVGVLYLWHLLTMKKSRLSISPPGVRAELLVLARREGPRPQRSVEMARARG